MKIKVIKPGLQDSIQDTGRVGYQIYGISTSGAMDGYAAQIANLLVGNDRHEAVIEICRVGPSLYFDSDCYIAVTGARFDLAIDGIAAEQDRLIYLKAGSCLAFNQASIGIYAYLAIRGKFRLPSVFGSKSTDIVAGFGGFKGRALRVDDEISVTVASNLPDFKALSNRVITTSTFFVRTCPLSNSPDRATIRVIKGKQFDQFTDDSVSLFLNTDFCVSSFCNRMGYRLNNKAAIKKKEVNSEMDSEAVTKGAIQIANDGQAIVLLSDRQTCGGYPKIANIISVDIKKMVNLASGTQLSFKLVSLAEAQALFIDEIKKIHGIAIEMQTFLSKAGP
ncbi:MAG: biotin-dependent carboxyltransferase family protein [Pseudomonadota bacterium]